MHVELRRDIPLSSGELPIEEDQVESPSYYKIILSILLIAVRVVK